MKKYSLFFLCFILSVAGFSQDLVPFSKKDHKGGTDGSLYGLKTAGGKVVVEPVYKYIEVILGNSGFFSAMLDVSNQKNNKVLLNRKGEVVSKATYSDIYYLGDGYFKIEIDQSDDMFTYNEMSGVVDSLGNEILPVMYGDISYLDRYKIFLVVEKNTGKKGIVDLSGKELIPIEYDDLNLEKSGLFYAEINKKGGIIDIHNNILIPLMQDYIHQYRNFYFASRYPDPDSKKMEMHVYNPQQPDINNYVYEDFMYWRSSRKQPALAAVKRDGKWGFVDSMGREVITPVYDTVESFTDDFCCTLVMKNQKIGMIAKSGEEVIPIKYDALYFPINENRLPAQLEGKYGFLDEKGKEIIPFTYDKIDRFENGKAQVQQNGRTFYIDVNGKEVE